MKDRNRQKIDDLMRKGVALTNPQAIEIGEEVHMDNISEKGVVIYGGCKIFGASTLILEGTTLGYEAPVTIQDCQLGPHVALAGGFFKNAVFLEGVKMGSGAHVREGTIMEEQANVAHTVALKQTILFPFVTLGSLINFCDCFMAGGTNRKDHSEVGSSYIHFNYTPNQDKATPSLLGDVPRGVMLDQPPIFLGGQGGLVGPCRIDFGNVISAGSIYRKDVNGSGHLLIGAGGRGGRVPFRRHIYPNVKRIVANNVFYIANLLALMQWYQHIRSLFISTTFPVPLYDGLLGNLEKAIDERIHRVDDFISRLPASLDKYTQVKDENQMSANIRHHQELISQQAAVMEIFAQYRQSGAGDETIRDRFIESLLPIADDTDKNYIRAIGMLEPDTKGTGTRWLVSIVDQVAQGVSNLLPSLSMGMNSKK